MHGNSSGSAEKAAAKQSNEKRLRKDEKCTEVIQSPSPSNIKK